MVGGRLDVDGWRDATALTAALDGVCADVIDGDSVTPLGRDWWPLGLHWALTGDVPSSPSVVCRPAAASEVAAVLEICHRAGMPVTPAAGRSGVCGGSVPAFGGVLLDLTALDGVVDVDTTSLLADIGAGIFGHRLEAALRDDHGVTTGHWPQSMELSTVGGWLACRSAGQYSTRYGKIEDIVTGLDVVLADGTALRTGGFPRQAVGPDLTQIFVGSEGTLGVVTGARLRVWPVPPETWKAAYGFPSFAAGIDACRRIMRRGATPAVLRLYDANESARSHDGDGATSVLLVLDEADPAVLRATHAVVTEECAGAARLDDRLVDGWLAHRNDVSALHALTAKGFVVDTMEIAAGWRRLPEIYDATVAALIGVEHAVAATGHLSHSYSDGACLYVTFAATPPAAAIETTYVALWDAGTRTALSRGGSLSHHHGVGLNRARFVPESLGAGFEVLLRLKGALDPAGILNPGKLGLPSPFGEVKWPR